MIKIKDDDQCGELVITTVLKASTLLSLYFQSMGINRGGRISGDTIAFNVKAIFN